jgi:hypothetical protein
LPFLLRELGNFDPKFSTFCSKNRQPWENLLVLFANMLFFALVLHFKN